MDIIYSYIYIYMYICLAGVTDPSGSHLLPCGPISSGKIPPSEGYRGIFSTFHASSEPLYDSTKASHQTFTDLHP